MKAVKEYIKATDRLFILLCVACSGLSVLALTQTGSMIPLVITAALAFLCIRHGGISMLDFLRYAAAFFFFGQQYYVWRESA